MFSHADIKGDRLPPKTLCLTYDDGPGPDTAELGRFLFTEGIGATFFVLGRHAARRQATLRKVHRWGHLIGNHTYSHPGLLRLAQSGGDVVREVDRTHAVIKDFVSGNVVFFRPPYGNWREKTRPAGPEDRPTSPVADVLNRSGRFAHYVGPIKWEIVAEDWAYWERGDPVEACAEAHLKKIDEIGRGIVLLHDSSDGEVVRVRNRTMELTKLLVPVLKRRGYRFVRLDAIPQVQDAVIRAAHGSSLRTQ
jgi:peptidoglycan/xylan/chitin deacetylase (PgdA/CDA1 family)